MAIWEPIGFYWAREAIGFFIDGLFALDKYVVKMLWEEWVGVMSVLIAMLLSSIWYGPWVMSPLFLEIEDTDASFAPF